MRGREELDTLRESCAQFDYHPTIVAKVERPEAFNNLGGICDAADEVWFCRGDLGSLVPWRELGALQRQAFSVARQRDCPLVVAGQVFHHLTEHGEPTRSEIVHFYEVVQGGAAGIVLSDETAIGADPVGAVTTIANLI